ncbi:rhodanese-like domain-containing protein [Streptomyces sp. VRA16 Mangrove soil]|uniref:rhodanese-like domain-containing protein n=1 Tax=Streptomyces sp. VRA16 Mangrove soil TaxID=2817434 RepID=UPI001A9CEB9D|nr:rhodanese-like domain-containing protein [Streptomyces sp. VRA16 Mangrove soil]MBO1332888.1 rhodanese-like domain-containing protein [Streptomyces sp. VRA16 Mangrove soil]
MSTTLAPAELHARPVDSTLVVDVRAPGEFAAGHVPGAVNVPADHLDALLPDLRAAAERRRIVVVCAAGQRSAAACAKLADAGVEAVGLDGGTHAWTAEGLPVDTAPREGRSVWAMDRQVRFTAGALVLAGLALGTRAPKGRLLAAGVASGLVYSGLSNTCGMAAVLGKLPFNRPAPDALDAARAALRA